MAVDRIQIKVDIRLALNSDLLIATGLMKFGQPYYLLDPKTKKLTGVHVLDKYHNYERLKSLQEQQCIYVPVHEFDFNIDYGLQQKDIIQKTSSRNQN